MLAAVLAQDKRLRRHADIVRVHDLVSLAIGEHAVLVDAGLVREGVPAHDSLVARRGVAGAFGQQRAGGVDAARLHARVGAVMVRAGAQCHHHFFHRTVARPFADTVERAFDLARASAHRGEAVGDRHAEIVVVVGREDHPIAHGNTGGEVAIELVNLLGRGVADRVGHVQHVRPRIGGTLQRFLQECAFGPDRVLGGKFDLVEPAGAGFHAALDLLQHFVGRQFQLELTVQRAGAEEHVDPLALCWGEGALGRVDIAFGRAGEGAHGRPLDLARDAADGLGIAGTGGGKADLHDVHFQGGNGPGHHQLAFRRQGKAGRLLPVAQGRVENSDAAYVAFSGLVRRLRHAAPP